MSERGERRDQETQETMPPGGRTFVEEIELAGNQLVDEIQRLVAEGNVQHVVVHNKKGRKLLEVPLTATVGVGAVVALAAPVLAALGALAALVAEVKIEITRVEPDGHDGDGTPDQEE